MEAHSPHRARAARAALLVILVAALAAWIATLDLRPSLTHVRLRLLSGPAEGNYHVLAGSIAAAAAKKGGRIENVESEGSLENVERLAAAAHGCEAQAALVQAGLPLPDAPKLELYGRLGKYESIFFLGKRGDSIKEFAELAHLRVGVGPEGSGTARVLRQVFELPDFRDLGVVLSAHPLAEQLDLAARGELDLAAFVIDEDAALVGVAVRERGLQIVGFSHTDVVARRFPFLHHGRIGAGQYDSVRMLPPTDREVLRVETLIVGNGCARRSQVLGLIASIGGVFPDFVRHNRETPNTTGLELAPAAKDYWERGGPDLVDDYLPRVADVMPQSNWVSLVMGVSILFNLMGVGNRFVLWRIDAARVRAERQIAACFGAGTTLGDIAMIDPGSSSGPRPAEGDGEEIDRVILDLEALAARSRRLSLTVLVPMGGEMAYRYQERLIHETLAVLRAFRERWRASRARAVA
jgi:NMT1-like family